MRFKRFVPVFVVLAIVAVQFAAEAKTRTQKSRGKAAIEKLVKECEAIADAALPEEISNTGAILNYAGLDTVSKAEAGALVKVVRAVKAWDRKAMIELEHGSKTKPSIVNIMRPQVAAFFKELAYFLWIGKGEIKDDGRDNCFAKGFLIGGYISTWGNPHIDKECEQKVRALFFHSPNRSEDVDIFVSGLEESKVIKECTVTDEKEVAVRRQRFCNARMVVTNLSGHDPMTCTND